MKKKSTPKRSASSQRWLQEHFKDVYVKKAHKQGYRSRAAFKLLAIQEKDQLVKSGMCVVDLGAAPGGWSQWLSTAVGDKGEVYALDILDMPPINRVNFIQGDFTSEEVFDQFMACLKGKKVDLVLSDMAPNMSGVAVSDQAKSMYLAELACEFAQKTLKPGGGFLVKVFQGDGFDVFLKYLRSLFKSVITRKPDASRARSREVYLYAKGFLGDSASPISCNPDPDR